MIARGLDVDVGGMQAQRVGEQLIDQPNHRRFLRGADQMLDIGAELADQILADIVDDPLQRRLAAPPNSGHRRCCRSSKRGDHRHDPPLQRQPDGLDGVAVAGVGHGQPDRVVGGPHRQHGDMAQEAWRDAVGQQRLARQLVAADQLELVVPGHRLGPVAAGDQAQAGDGGGEALALLLRGDRGAHGGIGRDPTGKHQPRQHRIELAGARILERRRGGTSGAGLDWRGGGHQTKIQRSRRKWAAKRLRRSHIP